MRWLLLTAVTILTGLALGFAAVYILSDRQLQDRKAVEQFNVTIPDDVRDWPGRSSVVEAEDER